MTDSTFTAAPLPYAHSALQPVISAKTMECHHGQHYSGYVKNLNALLGSDAQWAGKTLPQVVQMASKDPKAVAIYRNAAQAWNHEFYFANLAPAGSGGAPSGSLLRAIDSSFGSLAALQKEIVSSAGACFGSGWVWLVRAGAALAVKSTANADSTLTTSGEPPVLVIDVWEHAYYLDYQSARARHVEAVAQQLIDWRVVQQRWDKLPH